MDRDIGLSAAGALKIETCFSSSDLWISPRDVRQKFRDADKPP